MSDTGGTPELAPARFATNCRACGAPIAPGEPAARSPRTGALTCATCAAAEPRPAAPGRERQPGP
jgi:recombinational DNA repair protein (RecF pathway)